MLCTFSLPIINPNGRTVSGHLTFEWIINQAKIQKSFCQPRAEQKGERAVHGFTRARNTLLTRGYFENRQRPLYQDPYELHASDTNKTTKRLTVMLPCFLTLDASDVFDQVQKLCKDDPTGMEAGQESGAELDWDYR